MLTREQIIEIKENVNLIELAKYLGIKGKDSGDSYIAHSLYHEDSSPSFHIRKDKAYDFSMNKPFDCFELVKEKLSISFPEAINFILKQYLGNSLSIKTEEKRDFPPLYDLVSKEELRALRISPDATSILLPISAIPEPRDRNLTQIEVAIFDEEAFKRNAAKEKEIDDNYTGGVVLPWDYPTIDSPEEEMRYEYYRAKRVLFPTIYEVYNKDPIFVINLVQAKAFEKELLYKQMYDELKEDIGNLEDAQKNGTIKMLGEIKLSIEKMDKIFQKAENFKNNKAFDPYKDRDDIDVLEGIREIKSR